MSNDIDKIERQLEFAQPLDRVWLAITDPAEIRQWFGSDAQFDLKEGNIGFFEWQEECEGKFAMQIVRINAPTYFAWRWMLKEDVPFTLEHSTLVEWTLGEIPGGTKLTMKESGFASAKHHQMNTQGWDQELADLEQYLR